MNEAIQGRESGVKLASPILDGLIGLRELLSGRRVRAITEEPVRLEREHQATQGLGRGGRRDTLRVLGRIRCGSREAIGCCVHLTLKRSSPLGGVRG